MSELLIIQFPFIVIEVIKTPKKSNLSRKLLIWLLGLSRLNYKSYSLFSRQFKKKMVWGGKNPIGNEILCCVGVKLTHIHITCTAPLALRIFTSTSSSVQLGLSAVYDLFKNSWSVFWYLDEVKAALPRRSRMRPARFHTWVVATWNKLTVPHRIRKPPVWLPRSKLRL